jgi:nitric oxide reductase NorD protein
MRPAASTSAFRWMLPLCTRCVDVPDQQYLAEDARRAVQQLRRRGIDTFAFGIGNGPFSQLDQIFGERRAPRAPRIEVLPERVLQLYTELKK